MRRTGTLMKPEVCAKGTERKADLENCRHDVEGTGRRCRLTGEQGQVKACAPHLSVGF